MAQTQEVVTYRLAYLDRRVTLCADCAAFPDAPLGPVEYGVHDGFCEVCDAE